MSRQIQAMLLAVLALLSACGEVTVFGHVVREGNSKTAVNEAASSSASSSVSASASSSSQSATNLSAVPVTPPESMQPSLSSASTKVVAASDTANVVRQVKVVTLSISPDMMNKIKEDSRFNNKALLEAIKAELQARKLLNTSDSQAATTLSIYIDNYDLHANTNFSIFGARPHTGTLAGNLLLTDEQGQSMPVSHIETYTRISIPESGEDTKLLQPLYRDFAVTVANSLSGTHAPTSADRDQPPR